MTLTGRIKKLLYKSDNQILESDSLKTELKEVLNLLGVTTNEGCGMCIKSALNTLRFNYKDKIKSQSIIKSGIMKKYRLKDGTQLRIGTIIYTNDNLTDNIAKKLIKENKNYEGVFIIDSAKQKKTIKKSEEVSENHNNDVLGV